MTAGRPLSTDPRKVRVRSVACPHCGAPAGRPCTTAADAVVTQTHAARWEAWYAQRFGGAR